MGTGQHEVEITPDEREALVERAVLLAKDFDRVGPRADADNRFPLELVPLYKESGLVDLAVPKRYGGKGGDIWTVTRVSMELAKGDPACALAFNMHQTMVGIFRGLLDEPTKARVFRGIVEDQDIVCGPFSEDRAGLMGLADTVAIPDGDGWIIRGRKTWATLCLGADVVAFNATITDADGKLPEGHADHAAAEAVFVIRRDLPGVSIKETWDTMGMRATGTHTLVFDDVRIGPETYGGDFRGGLFSEFEWASLTFSGVYIGLAFKAYEHTRDTLRTKRLGATQAGPDVALRDIASNHSNLGRTLVDVETAYRALETTARILEEGRDAGWDPAVRLAHLDVTKVATTEAAIRATDAGLRMVGGSAYRRGHPLERLYRDARAGPFHPLTTDQAYEVLGRSELGLLGEQAQTPIDGQAVPA